MNRTGKASIPLRKGNGRRSSLSGGRWRAAFDGHRLDEMADLFTPDALFQGGGPEAAAGRDAVRDYYAVVPDNRSAAVTVLHTFMIGDETAGGFADVTFSDPDGWQVPARLSLVLQHQGLAPSGDAGILTVQGDIADPATGKRVIDAGVERFGRIDTLVNNAGIFVGKPFTEFTEDDFTSVVAVNLGGFFRITQEALRHMLAQGGGHIVQITTSNVDHANSAIPGSLASLTKGGLQSVTKALAIEYATSGIRSNAVAPGVIKTPMNPVETHDFLNALHPVGRMGEPSDIIDAVIYLENAPFVTGVTLHVDGGQSAGH